MLAKINRLPSWEVNELRQKGQILNREALRIYQLAGKTDQTRLSVSVGVRAVKLAVRRNRIKRLLHTAMQQLISKLKQPTDLLIQVKRDLSQLKQAEVNQLLQEALLC